ncbi:The GLUG motif-containing protein [Gracilibacillus ureilyticus]|uniref:The GLUG motif-containing protein n=1 Tax=Gracilibacillus ureilyticus TaxID=531814 RepID=A0A1H9ULE4_9BACI|nr:GLUG motif-containing protein [Gracilibacillus ureilyticus]SES10285.1 The GLUG motif-containing protein [Gracilibacillus ureilyticus]
MGSEENPYLIDSIAKLRLMKDLDEAESIQHFKLVSNINMDGETWDPFEFNGVLDGNGFIISDVTINQPEGEDVGFFRKLHSDGKLINVQLSDISITGRNCVGGLVGRNYGHIDHSFVTGSVIGNGYFIGGLVGVNETGTLTNSNASGSVIGNNTVPDNPSSITMTSADSGTTAFIFDPQAGTGSGIGGLAGINYSGIVTDSNATNSVRGNITLGGLIGYNYYGTIDHSYATGSIIGNYTIGGMIGSNLGDITDSYATGNVTGNVTGSVAGTAIGGLIGNSFGYITNSYAIGNVAGTANSIGGLVGMGSSIVTNSYYEEIRTGQSYDNGMGNPRTSEQMQKGYADSTIGKEEIYTGWDSEIWDFGNDMEYPKLR